MSYQINFHTFLVVKDLLQDDRKLLESTVVQAFVHEELIRALTERWPDLMQKIQIGQGRVEVSYLGL